MLESSVLLRRAAAIVLAAGIAGFAAVAILVRRITTRRLVEPLVYGALGLLLYPVTFVLNIFSHL